MRALATHIRLAYMKHDNKTDPVVGKFKRGAKYLDQPKINQCQYHLRQILLR